MSDPLAPAAGVEPASAPSPAAPVAGASSAPAPSAAPSPEAASSAAPVESPRVKALQAEHAKLTQLLGSYGGVETVKSHLELVKSLREDAEFQAWAKARAAQARTGSSDPQTVQALELIERIAEEKATAQLQPVLHDLIQRRVDGVLAKMDKTHPTWRQHESQVGALYRQWLEAGILSPTVDQNPTFEILESLYHAVAGKDPAWRRATYEAEVKAKQAQSTTATPGLAPSSVGTPKVDSLQAAYAAAKSQLGIS